MARRPLLLLTSLALGLGASSPSALERLQPLPAAQVRSLRAQEPSRVARIQAALQAQKAALGLGAADGLAVAGRFTDAYGETHVHLQQTYRGVKVWNGHLVGHMDASGKVKPAHATVQQGIALEGGPLLDATKAGALALAQLPPGELLVPLRIEPVVFPARYQDGLKLARTASGGLALDTRLSVGSPRLKAPYAWAYHVSVRQRGGEALELIVDGRTGHVLKKWDGLEHVAAVGKGHSQYNGDVTLNTDDLGDGTFRLLDSVRPTREWPMASQWSYFVDLQGVGMRVIEGLFIPALLSTTNEWGDGLPFSGLDNPRSRETAGVDALFGAGATWDYYQNVLGRTGGIDGNGSSPLLTVHYGTSSSPPYWNNAAWDPAMFMMYFGDGAETGALTCLDVTAHELSHGVFAFTARLNYRGEAAGVNEANSDVHAVMTKFYQWGAGGAGSTVPDTVTSPPGGVTDPLSLWSIGGQLATAGEPLRWLYKPSLDGVSYDAWFDGIGLDDSHFSMGPGNRAFFFLAQGASSDPQSVTYSPYLPGGMTGLGNDAAVKLWFHAMATKVTDPETSFHALRAALIESAAELYGDAAVAAVQNAFAAVNVGAPAGGQEPLTVMLPVDPAVAANFGDSHLVVVPRMVPSRLPTPLVNGVPDGNVTWSLGGLSPLWPVGGKILEGGIFLAPEFFSVEGDWPVKVSSNADPLRYAAAIVVSLSLDCDADTDVDALDLGALAVTYGLGRPSGVYPGSNLTGSNTGVDDVAVAAFLLGFNNAYKH